jgi:hypothetical protein
MTSVMRRVFLGELEKLPPKVIIEVSCAEEQNPRVGALGWLMVIISDQQYMQHKSPRTR